MRRLRRRHGRIGVQAGGREDPGRRAVRHDRLGVARGELEDAHHLADPARVDDVRLEDVRVRRGEEIPESPAVMELLAGRDRDVQGAADLAQAGQVMLRERFLEMCEPERLQLAPDADRRPDRIAAVGVEADPDVRAERLPAPTSHLDVLGRVHVALERTPVHPDLERLEPLAPPAQHVGDHPLDRLGEAGADAPVQRDVGPGGAAQQGVERQTGALAHEVPQADVDHAGEGTGGRVRELARAIDQALADAARRQRVRADELRLDDTLQVAAEDRGVVPAELGQADDALVGDDLDQGRADRQAVEPDIRDSHVRCRGD